MRRQRRLAFAHHHRSQPLPWKGLLLINLPDVSKAFTDEAAPIFYEYKRSALKRDTAETVFLILQIV